MMRKQKKSQTSNQEFFTQHNYSSKFMEEEQDIPKQTKTKRGVSKMAQQIKVIADKNGNLFHF